MDRLWKNVSLALGSLLVGALAMGVVMSLPDGIRSCDADAQDRVGAPANLAAAQDLSAAFRNVAEMLQPSVVSISIKQTFVRRRGMRNDIGDIFGDRRSVERAQRETGMGSGVIVSRDGYILTNNHVVEDAEELDVELNDGRTVAGRIVGTDPETDLAVVKVDANGLVPATFGDSDEIRVGDWVLAIGSPFGLDHTVTAGIISGKNRDQNIIKDGEGFEDFLQTDAAINPGNSGGALVNLRGELVGINTAILSRSGTSAGIGFAIPVSLAKPVLNSIVNDGVVKRGFLGAQVHDVTPQLSKEFDLPVNAGAMVVSVLEDQPAAKSGLQPGDVVTELDGTPVKSGGQLRNYVASRPPNSVIKMKVNRAGKVLQVAVHLRERTGGLMARFESGEVLGAQLVPVNDDTMRKYGYSGLRSGLIVTNIRDNSDADTIGLKEGDVIESAGGVELKSADAFSEVMDEVRRRRAAVQIVVRRGNTRAIVPIR